MNQEEAYRSSLKGFSRRITTFYPLERIMGKSHKQAVEDMVGQIGGFRDQCSFDSGKRKAIDELATSEAVEEVLSKVERVPCPPEAEEYIKTRTPFLGNPHRPNACLETISNTYFDSGMIPIFEEEVYERFAKYAGINSRKGAFRRRSSQ